ncbi:hypothetical protein D3C73_1228960 [compost metagenome]
MDDTVVGGDIRLDHIGVIHLDLAVGDGHGDGAAFNGLDLAGLDVLGHDLARHDVIRQHLGQRGLVLQQRVQLVLRHLGKCRVSRRKNGERARTLQRVGQAGGLHRGRQGIEPARRFGRVHDVGGIGPAASQGNGRSNQKSLHVVLQKVRESGARVLGGPQYRFATWKTRCVRVE